MKKAKDHLLEPLNGIFLARPLNAWLLSGLGRLLFLLVLLLPWFRWLLLVLLSFHRRVLLNSLSLGIKFPLHFLSIGCVTH